MRHAQNRLFRSKLLLLCCVSLLVGFQWATAQVNKAPKRQYLASVRLDDPVFGISHNPDAVKYERVPRQISRLCPDFRRGTL